MAVLTVMKHGDDLWWIRPCLEIFTLHYAPLCGPGELPAPDLRLIVTNGTFEAKMTPRCAIFFVITVRRTNNTGCIRMRRPQEGTRDSWSRAPPTSLCQDCPALQQTPEQEAKCSLLYGTEILWLSVTQHYYDHS